MKTLRLTLALAILLSCARYAHAQAPTPLAAFSPLPTTGRTGPQFGADVDTRVSNLRTYADQKSRDNISGVLNLLSYGASGSSTATTGTISAASSSLTLAGAIDFKNGQGIAITGAGATNTAALPTGLSAALPAWPGAFSRVPYDSQVMTGLTQQYLIKPTNNNAGANIYEVSGVNAALSGSTGGTEPTWSATCPAGGNTCSDSGITWTQVTSSVTTSYSYKVAAFDANFGVSAATSAATCTALATLSELNPCIVTWTAGANDVGVLVYQNNVLVGVVPASDQIFYDTGTSALSGYHPDFPTSPPGSALPGRLVTTIASGGGTTTLTLAAVATTSATTKVVNHDDTAALRSWVTAVLGGNGGTRGYCPEGTYQTTGSININPSGPGHGVHLTGPMGQNELTAGCNLTYNGNPKNAEIYANQLGFSVLDHLTLNANRQALYGIQIDNSDGNHLSTNDTITNTSVQYLSLSVNAAGMEFGHPGMGAWEVANMTVRNSFINGNGGLITGAGVNIEDNTGNVLDYYFHNLNIQEVKYGYRTGGIVGALIIDGGEILGTSGYDIYAPATFQQGAISVRGVDSQIDGLTGSSFVLANAAPVNLTGNLWTGATQSDDSVVSCGSCVLLSNTFLNLRTTTSVTKIHAYLDNGTPGTADSGTLVSMGNTYENVTSPFLPPIYDSGSNLVSDFVNGFPFNAQPVPMASFGDNSVLETGGHPYALQAVNYGGDVAVNRLFTPGVASAPVIDSNSGHPLLENLQIQGTGSTAPTATCSGGSTGVSIATGSTNNRGQITSSSSASTDCTITWSAVPAWTVAPFCVFDDANASVAPLGVSVGACGTSTCVIDFASATSKKFNWVCM